VAAGFVGTVLLLAGLAKLASRDWRAVAGLSSDRSGWLYRVVAGLPVAEIGCGAAVIAGFRWAGAVAAMLLFAFTAVLAVRLRHHDAAPCGCFGEVSTRPVSPLSIGRNLLLLAAAVVVAAGWDTGRHGTALVAGRVAGAAVGLVLVIAERSLTPNSRGRLGGRRE
jgi:hypothetical protein